MSEETNEAAKKPTLTERLIEALKSLIRKKGEVRGAKKALRNCSRRERRAVRWDAAASKFDDEAAENAKAAKAAKAAEESAKASGDKKAAEESAKAAEESAKAEEAARAAADDARNRASGIRARSADVCRERLQKRRDEREELIASVNKLLHSISGYSRKDRLEVNRLRKLAGV